MLEVELPFESVLDVIAMDWDPINDEMYWAESHNDKITIRRGKMRPPYHEVCLQFFCETFKKPNLKTVPINFNSFLDCTIHYDNVN